MTTPPIPSEGSKSRLPSKAARPTATIEVSAKRSPVIPDRDMFLSMELEAKFAALVARARGVTRLADPVGGQDHRVCEVIVVALCDLYDEGIAAGLDPSAIEEIANRYLEWDINNDPWPKSDHPMPEGNVVAFRRSAAWLEIARSARYK